MKGKKKPKRIGMLVLVGILGASLLASGGAFLSGGYNQSQSSGQNIVVAEVNGEKIYASEIDQIEANMQQGQQQGADSEPTKKDALERAITRKLILQQADKEGVDVSLDKAETDLENLLKKQGRNIEELKQRVSMQGGNYAEVLQDYRKQLILEKFVDQKMSPSENVQVSDKEARAFFEENKQFLLAMQGENKSNVAYEDVSGQIKELMSAQKQQQSVSKLLEEMRQNANITRYEDKL